MPDVRTSGRILLAPSLLFNVRTEDGLPPRGDGSKTIRTVYHDLPDGTEIEAATFDDVSGSIMLRLWNDSWDEVGEACQIPDISIAFTTTSFVIVPSGKNQSGETVYEAAPDAPIKFREFI